MQKYLQNNRLFDENDHIFNILQQKINKDKMDEMLTQTHLNNLFVEISQKNDNISLEILLQIYSLTIFRDFYIPLNKKILCQYFQKELTQFDRKFKYNIKQIFQQEKIYFFEQFEKPNLTLHNSPKIIYVKAQNYLEHLFKTFDNLRIPYENIVNYFIYQSAIDNEIFRAESLEKIEHLQNENTSLIFDLKDYKQKYEEEIEKSKISREQITQLIQNNQQLAQQLSFLDEEVHDLKYQFKKTWKDKHSLKLQNYMFMNKQHMQNHIADSLENQEKSGYMIYLVKAQFCIGKDEKNNNLFDSVNNTTNIILISKISDGTSHQKQMENLNSLKTKCKNGRGNQQQHDDDQNEHQLPFTFDNQTIIKFFVKNASQQFVKNSEFICIRGTANTKLKKQYREMDYMQFATLFIQKNREFINSCPKQQWQYALLKLEDHLYYIFDKESDEDIQKKTELLLEQYVRQTIYEFSSYFSPQQIQNILKNNNCITQEKMKYQHLYTRFSKTNFLYFQDNILQNISIK